MTSRQSTLPEGTANREIVVTRVFEAPRELVWRAWVEQRHVARWWGPNGFTTTTHEMDVKPGGLWRFIMHGPDGTDYDNLIEYLEVVPPERLVYDHSGGTAFRVTVTFAEEGRGTGLTMRSVFPSVAERDRVVREFRAIEGANQTLGRL
ncbi:MAG TPA: SRPBCC family protein, partial [Gemmatimonadales bacterium]|nr:SRPBCC family protein [Gemmatimonadales bacterium]